ncbi:MAG: TIGR02300 family protein [Acetobacteraceae bacterium]|nr:TIGR02300 family protein [Acetobacteraceae bacterium]
MAKPELGAKRVCVSCQARFYDLARVPAVCPKCGVEQPLGRPRPRRMGGNVADTRALKKPVPESGIEEVEVEGVEDTEDEDVLEDAADLEDDADAISTDIEVGTDRDDPER